MPETTRRPEVFSGRFSSDTPKIPHPGAGRLARAPGKMQASLLLPSLIRIFGSALDTSPQQNPNKFGFVFGLSVSLPPKTPRRMKFALSYSCGKESSLALNRLIEAGHRPVCLLTMVRTSAGRSYFHGADPQMLRAYSEALGLPMIECPSDGDDYAEAFERGIARARTLGAEAVAFGDIDIEENRRWEEERCARTDMRALFPLWGARRTELLDELFRLGFVCLVKCIDTETLPRTMLGQRLTPQLAAEMAAAGIDLCGERGEYHTLVADGPIFMRPLDFEIGPAVELGRYAAADIRLRDANPTKETQR